MERVYPNTWEEYCKIEGKNPLAIEEQMPFVGQIKRYGENNPDRYYSPAFIALAKLIELRDYYNDQWIPDWSDTDTHKFVIERMYANEWNTGSTTMYPCVLAFRTAYLRDMFYKNFKDLIEKAKECI